MVSQRKRGSIVFVSSFLGYTSFAGYSTYSPGKYALRGERRSVCRRQAVTSTTKAYPLSPPLPRHSRARTDKFSLFRPRGRPPL